MNLVDANVLLYAVNPTADGHGSSKAWLDDAMNSTSTVLLPWLSLLAFLRLSTQKNLLDRPFPIDRAIEVVEGWLRRPNVVVPQPDVLHARRMRELLTAAGRAGNLVNDAHLAALAIQWDATVVTFDTDFALFPGVRWELPGLP